MTRFCISFLILLNYIIISYSLSLGGIGFKSPYFWLVLIPVVIIDVLSSVQQASKK
jgi:hypothetical protein